MYIGGLYGSCEWPGTRCGLGCASCGVGSLGQELGMVTLPVVGDVDVKTLAVIAGLWIVTSWITGKARQGVRQVRRRYRQRAAVGA